MGQRYRQYQAALAGIALALAGCSGSGPPRLGAAAPPETDRLGQGWTTQQRQIWYRGTQGSRLIPERWLLALEAADSTVKFMAPENFDRFNYLPDPLPRPARTPAWPIGFALDAQDDRKLVATQLRWYDKQGNREPWIGMGCAACHTTKISVNGSEFLVEGGVSMADFQGFSTALLKSLQATADDSAKFDRFAAEVLKGDGRKGPSDTPANRVLLKTALTTHLKHQNRLEWYNQTGVEPGYPEPSVYGHGRLDAVGHILNKMAYLAAGENKAIDLHAKRLEPNAPVSYPFIWNASQHDRLQWNGIVPNIKISLGPGGRVDAGALVRNASEVIGVFADVDVSGAAGFGGFASSVDVRSLVGLETQLATLKSPLWPAAAGTPDPGLVRWGERLFKQRCAGCHAPLAQDDVKTPIKAEMTPIWGPGGVGTDPWMACNAFSYQARAGLLTGSRISVVAGEPLNAIEPNRQLLRTVTIASLLGHKWQEVGAAIKIALGGKEEIRVYEEPPPPPPPPSQPPVRLGAQRYVVLPDQISRDERLKNCMDAAAMMDPPPPPQGASPDEIAKWQRRTHEIDEDRQALAYKARPLNGIWATAPYLHNGSVKSLFEILLPPGQRTASFWVGNPELDTREVGFVNQPSATGSWFRVRDASGKPIHGNSNAGHDYGNASMTDAERWALVAFMKTL
ncbi:di-heme-cytochrome C peroxidase [Sandarakinorhabdus sp. AAP62]|uniref:di-heme-cytochrome C peroxidase n=1 Tax=Sandarakinorhabdus sp. AAP62 TaxID=1248916 RepID=UPI0002D45948|nr:di-heme-cytochrome C peroxidase [Sandarakinorhabdus sp. AAP62]